MIKAMLLVGAGSFFGGIARYLVACLLRGVGAGFPWATLTANVLGCLLIGVLWSLFSHGQASSLNLFLVVGFCGGFTTFSTFSKESLALLQSGDYTLFCLYALGSVALGILAVLLGYVLAK
ncbi:MAG: fluoride efflux transporter CrcB [Paludibacteraceae bacterium]|nr:fluoride efflux transporter CrcB [Paludibacteraceae bacterium]